MKYAVAVIAVAVLSSCAIFQSPSLEGGPDCSSKMTVEGTERLSTARYMADLACLEVQEALNQQQADKGLEQREFERVPKVHVRVYGAGEAPEFCGEYRSGTCIRKDADGAYSVEVRRPTYRERTSGQYHSVSHLIRHEFQHAALFELMPMVSAHEHHRMLLEMNVCSSACTNTYKFKEPIPFGR